MYTTDFHGTFYSRKLLLDNPLPLTLSSPPTAAPPPSTADVSSFDNNVLLILAVTLCGLIFSFGINFMLRCALRCANSLVSESGGTPAAQPAKRGIKEKALKTFPVVKYSAEMNERVLPGLDTECVICLLEFEAGESLRMLPKCNHGFHVGCIDKWLKSHSSCPKCRQCLIETCQKIVRTAPDSSP